MTCLVATGVPHESWQCSEGRYVKATSTLTQETDNSYDNSRAETINYLFKAVVIYRRGPWRSFAVMEYATLEWLAGFNDSRLLELIEKHPAGGGRDKLLCGSGKIKFGRATKINQLSASPAGFKKMASSIPQNVLWQRKPGQDFGAFEEIASPPPPPLSHLEIGGRGEATLQ